MHTLDFKDHGVVLHYPFGQTASSPFMPWWAGLGSRPIEEPTPRRAKNTFTEQPSKSNQFVISPKLNTTIVVPCKEEKGANDFSASRNTKDSADGQAGTYPTSLSLQSPLMRNKYQVEFSANYPSMDQFYGLYAVYGAQQSTGGRMLLPLNVPEYGPIFVNAKQYHGILRRRLSRAKVSQHKKITRGKKPYLHESRHLHAMRRARGIGGRFLNTKNTDDGKTVTLKDKKRNKHLKQPHNSLGSEVFEPNNSENRNSGKELMSLGTTSSGSEVTSVYSHPDFNNYPVNKWVTAADGCCDFLKV